MRLEAASQNGCNTRVIYSMLATMDFRLGVFFPSNSVCSFSRTRDTVMNGLLFTSIPGKLDTVTHILKLVMCVV